MEQEAGPLHPAEWTVTWPQKVSTLAGAISVLTGAVVLAAWWLQIAFLVRPIPGAPAMVPNTASCFFFLGMSLLLLRHAETRQRRRRLAQASIAVALMLAVITLVEYATARDLRIDDVFAESPLAAATGYPTGRIGPGSAMSFLLIGLALLTLDLTEAVRIDLSEAFAIGTALVAAINAAGYMYGAHSLYESRLTPNAGMAPHSVVMVLVLSAGVICARPRRPLMALVTSHRVGGFVVRRLLLGAATIPLLGLLVMLGQQGSLYDAPYAEALLAVTAMAIAVGLVISIGDRLDRIDVARTASERALAEREERLRDLIQQASDGVFIANVDGYVTEVNDAGCRMLGYPRDEIIGRALMDFIPAKDHPRLDVAKAMLLSVGTQVDEWTVQRRDGSHLPVEVSSKILRGGRWQGLVRDISARKEVERATDAVAEAVTGSPESSLRAVLENIALGAKLVANAEYAAFGFAGDIDQPFDPWVVVGLTSEEASQIGRAPRPIGLLGLVAERDHPIRIANIERDPVFRGLPPHHPPMTSFLGVPIRRHGRSIGNLFLANKLGAAEFSVADERAVERFAARAGTVIETARLYQAEGLERAWLQTVIDQMPEAVVLSDATGATRVENRSMQIFSFDTGQRDHLGQPVRYDLRLPNGQAVPLDDQPQVRALEDGTTTIGQELSLRRPDGRMVPMLVSAAPVYDAHGNRSGTVTIYQDISTLKELERMREEWSSIVAHDLRQPVGLIVLEAEALDRMVDLGQMEEGRKVVDRIRRSATRLNKMIDDLLDVSRIEARRLSLERVETDLASFMDDVVERLSSLAPGHRVRFQALVRPAPALVDALRLEQVLGNLISNAAKYGLPEDEISIELTRYGSEYKVAVRNRGGGIEPTEMPMLFQRFSRSRKTSGGTVPGLGVGLYICRNLVEAHGGHIWAESIPGQTTTLHFTIPMLPGSTQAAA
jgi:PAS domain S-box-containing protein